MATQSMLGRWLIDWLNYERSASSQTLCNFNRLSTEIRPGDVLLVEGRTRASQIVKTVTQSIWTHSAIYIGRLREIENAELRQLIQSYYPANQDEQLLIEPLLGKGTVVSSLNKYKYDHLRVCRPKELSLEDVNTITRHVVNHLGTDYNIRQVFDVARYSFPYTVFPRRLGSSLFVQQPVIPAKTVCSSMIASAFSIVGYPIRPIIHHDADGRLRLFNRNAKIYVPSDFDASPYFDIIKYPYPGLDDPALFRHLPWDNQGMVCNTERECFVPIPAAQPMNRFAFVIKILRRVMQIKQWIPLFIPGITSR